MISATAQVTPVTLVGRGVVYQAPLGTYSDVVGTFTDANLQAVPGGFVSTIQWGDGSTSAGIVAGRNGQFTVNGSHSYTKNAAYTVAVSVADSGGGSTSFTSTLYVGVTPPPSAGALVGEDPPINAVEGTQFSGPIGSFTDSDGNQNPALYSATINWGDNTQSAATITGTNPFTVSGAHTYLRAGSYAVTTTVYDTDGANFPISSTATVADAPLTLKYKYPVSATAGIPFTDPLIGFTDADPNGTAADYTSTIAWGDGQTSAGTISGSASAFYVNGTHTYAQGGTYTAVVTATDYGGSSVSASTQITAGGITASGVDLNYTANLASGNLDVANFTDSDGNGNSSMYTATIHWGDGTSSSGMVSGGFKVFGNHTYAQQGYYTITTAIVDGDGATATATSNANVERGLMTATSQLPTSSVSSLTFSGNVASVSDTDGDRTIGDYKASIAWGDGSSSAGTISCNGTVYVSGSHSYAASGSYPVTVTITKIDSSLATINGTLTMSPGSGPLTITTSSNLAGVKGTSFNGVVATFVDSDNNTNPYMYSATLVWGDGSSGTSGTIAYSSANHDFTITGSHIYAEAGTYTIGITLHDNDGASAGTGVSITIGDAALTATAHNLSATAGVPLSAVTAATFSDVDTSASDHRLQRLDQLGRQYARHRRIDQRQRRLVYGHRRPSLRRRRQLHGVGHGDRRRRQYRHGVGHGHRQRARLDALGQPRLRQRRRGL